MQPIQSSRPLFLLLPAFTMSLGWAFRGFIGGGPLGAMIPGALVALVLALLLRLPPSAAGGAAAFGAIGVGFGGEMTYGQTVGFAGQAATMSWGLLGLALKGGAWGLLGGAVVGIGFTRSHHSSRRIVAAFASMVAACAAGWRLVNQPKLIYFSNLADRPREEVWAGLLAAGLAVLLVIRHPAVTRFSLTAAAGGFLGFGGGGLFIALHRIVLPQWNWLPSWKLMEYTFGFLFGLALAAAAWSLRESLPHQDPETKPAPPLLAALLITVALVLPSVYLSEALPVRFAYLIVGAALMSLLLVLPWLSWHLAISMTFACFAWDLAESVSVRSTLVPTLWGWIFVGASSLAFWLALDRRLRQQAPPVRYAFLLLLGSSMAVASVKTAAQVAVRPYFPAEYPLFVAAFVIVLWLGRRSSALLLPEPEFANKAGTPKMCRR